jgi:type I restriction-modification system DNA methylase subunit
MFDRSRQGTAVKDALHSFKNGTPGDGSRALLQALGYSSDKTIRVDGSVSQFLSMIDREGSLAQSKHAQTDRWHSADFVFQLTNDELPMLATGQKDLHLGNGDYHRGIIESFVFLTIGLDDGDWTRTQLAEITRAVNRLFPMPAIIFFHHGGKLTLSVIPRRPNKKDSSRDVIEPTRKVALIKDVDLANPHRAHLDIITDLHIQSGEGGNRALSNFDELYQAWTKILSTEELNKRFYRRLSSWYIWAVGTKKHPHIGFPVAAEVAGDDGHKLNQISVIRLLTRLIFVWFIKEKGLVPNALFNSESLKGLLEDDPAEHPEDSTYYKAILQNLFFATLNTQMEGDGRKWRLDKSETGRTADYLISNLFRYKDAFRDPDEALGIFRKVPFLNGGLFECLDREVADAELERNPELAKWISLEGKQKVIRADGFSERKSNPLHVPNKIFFAVAETGEDVDEALNEGYGTKKTGQKVDGLIRIFESYKFTVEENTPFDEEVALDPELLGKVFENLIASYNEDTSTTARKKSGTFYTPRVVVDYMVDEALVGFLKPKLEEHQMTDAKGLSSHKNISQSLDLGPAPGEFELSHNRDVAKISNSGLGDKRIEAQLRSLLSYEDVELNFSEDEKDRLIASIEGIRAIDPACGSGAFPMGLLQKLIHVLKRLDPDNSRWKAALRDPLIKQLKLVESSRDIGAKSEQIEALKDQLEKLDRDFSETSNFPDYARKLYVIDKCIHGVDIQPIAVQIAKLRFFISLVVSQKIDETAENLNITPLPNLETRLVAANALRPIDRPRTDDMFRNPKIEETEKALVEANERYFGARNRRTKIKAKTQIGELRDTLSDLLRQTNDLPEETSQQIARWDPFDQNAAADFFDPEWMFGLTEKFNIVMANPPYVRQEKIGRDKVFFKKRADENKRNKDALRLYQSFTGTADYLVYFMERGLDLLAPGGSFVFITSNKWYLLDYGKNIRGWIGRNALIRSIIDFGDADVFDAIAYPTIIMATKRPGILAAPDPKDVLLAWNWPPEMDRKDISEFPELFRNHAFEVPQKSLDNERGWQFETKAKRELLERIRNAGKPLGEHVEGGLYRGITTGFNDAFVVSGKQRKELLAGHKSAQDLLAPYLRGKDVKRWHAEESDLWLIKIPSSENQQHPWTGLGDTAAEKIFASSYPSIHQFLAQFRSELIARYDQGRYFWELRSCRYWDDFDVAKIISTKISSEPTFAIDRTGSVLSNTSYFFPASHLGEFTLAILNSQVSKFLSKYLFATKQGGFYEVQPGGLKQIPVPEANQEQTALVGCISKLLEASRDPRLEQLLNGLVYELFFPEDLHSRDIRLFDSCDRADLGGLSKLEGDALKERAEVWAREISTSSHEIYRMLFDLRALDVVRLIEGEE